MSTGKEIVADTGQLLKAVDDLMQAKTTQKVVDVARKVKCGSVINSAVDLVDKPLVEIGKALMAFRDLAAQLGGLSGLLGLLQPLLSGSNRILQTSTEQLEFLGLSGTGMQSIQDALNLVADQGDRILSGGRAVLDNYPDRVDVENLIKEYDGLRQTIRAFKQEIPNG